MYSSALRGFCTLYKKRQSLNNFFFLMILMIHMVQRQNKVNSGDNSGLAFKLLFDCMNPIWCIHFIFILTSEVYVRYIVSVLQALNMSYRRFLF